MNNLYNIIKDFDSQKFNNKYSADDLQKLRIDVSFFYSEAHQVNLLKNFINYKF